MRASVGAPLRVLLLLPGAFGPAGGLEMYDRLVIKGFTEICASIGGSCRTLILNDRPDDLDARYYDGGVAPSVFSRRKVAFVREAIRAAVRFRPDLVVFGHVHFAPLAFAIRAVRPSATRWFLTYGIEFWRRLPLLQRSGVSAAERILSISDYTRRQGCAVNRIPLEKTSLLPCALDPFWERQFEPADIAPGSKPILLTVARLAAAEHYKGIELVISAVAALRDKFPELEYRVVGDGDDRAHLGESARRHGVADRVRFLGRVSPDKLADAYRDASLFVMPSRMEGFGIVFLEAALFGMPSIGGNHGGTPEVIAHGETGFVVEYGDVSAIARTIGDMLADRPRLRKMGLAAQARLKNGFTYSTFKETLTGLVKGAVG